MEINIHIGSNYNVSHSKEISQLYGITPITRILSYNVPINILKEYCRDEDKIKIILTSSGIDSDTINKIINSTKDISILDNNEYHQKLMETINSHISKSRNVSRELSNMIIIGNMSNHSNLIDDDNNETLRKSKEIAALSIVYEKQSTSQQFNEINIVEKQKPIKWYHKLCCY